MPGGSRDVRGDLEAPRGVHPRRNAPHAARQGPAAAARGRRGTRGGRERGPGRPIAPAADARAHLRERPLLR